jgi:hypothetical protein
MCEATAADKPPPTIFEGIVDTSLETSTNSEERMELQHYQQAIMVRRKICTFGC